MKPSDYPGVKDLVGALRALQCEFDLAAISATVLIASGPMTVRIAGLRTPVVTLEDSEGHLISPTNPLV